MSKEKRIRWTPALTVIVIFGVISMLGDMVYEGARSVNSQYLNLIGITAAQVGLVFGIGEFFGYFLRLFAGLASDKSGKHWLFIFLGYGILLVVPIIGFTMHWNFLIVLILAERIGKSLRNPAKDTVLSTVAEGQVGTGFAFGLQEALDQLGAFSGPLIFTLVFAVTGSKAIAQYQTGYRFLFVPFVALMVFVFFAFKKTSRDNLIPDMKVREYHPEKLKPIFWIYTVFTFFGTLGFVNFSLIGYHLKADHLISDADITLLYSGAMIVDAVVALIIGRLYDRMKARSGKKSGGLVVLLMIPVVTVALPFLVLGSSPALIVVAMVIFGVVMGTHETIMRSAIADITPFHKRGTGYGVFNTGYGLALMAGAALMGWLYDQGMNSAIMALSCVSEAIAVVLFFWMHRATKRE